MFSSKDLKVKLVYMGFGGMIAIIGMLFAIGMLSSVTAQNDKFDTIQCSRLEVVDADGKVRVVLQYYPFLGYVTTYGKDGLPQLMLGTDIEEHGGHVIAYGKGGESQASLGIGEHGGHVTIYGKGGESQASLGINEHGGYVQVKAKGKGAAVMGINEYGNGAVSSWDKNGYRQ